MKLGDLLEWLAGAALTNGVYVLAGRAGAAISCAACLAYFAQCYGATRLPFGRPQGNKRPVK